VLVWYQLLDLLARSWYWILSELSHPPGPSIGYFLKLSYQPDPGIGSVSDLSNQSGPNIGFKTDFWLVSGRCISGI
jgi:hypothetical protein